MQLIPAPWGGRLGVGDPGGLPSAPQPPSLACHGAQQLCPLLGSQWSCPAILVVSQGNQIPSAPLSPEGLGGGLAGVDGPGGVS